MDARRSDFANLDAWKALAIKGVAPADVALLKSYVAEVKADGAARTIDFTISTGAVDRDRDTIDPAGWKLTAFRKNPVVQWAHDYAMPPIGRATKIRVDGDALKATAEFATAEVYPFAETIYQLLKGGFLQATSVGFRPLKHNWNDERGGVDFASQELLEFSIVPVPANADCLMEGKAAGIDIAPMREWGEAVAKALKAIVQAQASFVNQAQAYTGWPGFNLRSPKQLAYWLYTVEGLKIRRRIHA